MVTKCYHSRIIPAREEVYTRFDDCRSYVKQKLNVKPRVDAKNDKVIKT